VDLLVDKATGVYGEKNNLSELEEELDRTSSIAQPKIYYQANYIRRFKPLEEADQRELTLRSKGDHHQPGEAPRSKNGSPVLGSAPKLRQGAGAPKNVTKRTPIPSSDCT